MLDLLYVIFIIIEILALINIPVLLLLEISHQDYKDGMKFLITVVIGAIVSFIIYDSIVWINFWLFFTLYICLVLYLIK